MMAMMAQSPHGLSCNGCDVANDDIAELEKMQKIEHITHELFANAARIHEAMRTNRLLSIVFQKYKHVCREILQEKHTELMHLVSLCDYCDAFQDKPHQTKHNLKCIQHEINDIRNEIETLEELHWSDDESESDDSESDSDDDDVLDDEDVDEEDDVLDDEDEDEDEDEDDDNASVDSSSSSSSDSVMDMATFH